MTSSLVPVPTYNQRESLPRMVPRLASLVIDDAACASRDLTERLFEPRVSVVVPARRGAGAPEAVKSLEALAYPREKLEVVVAWGRSPSRQRNKAVEATSGEYILFLDDDSQVSADLLKIYLSVFDRDPTVGAVGGPAASLGGGGFQDFASLVLGEPSVLGRSASRYRARGKPRFSDERELILCNLCVRRGAFEAAGGFNERLYPNEENEFLERLRLSGWQLVYRPDAVVRRPQRETLGALLKAIARYGAGRAAQVKCLASRVSVARLAWVALGLAGALTGLVGLSRGSVALAMPLTFYAVYVAALAMRFSFRVGVRTGILGALLSALLQGTYAFGVLWGFLLPCRPLGERVVTMERLDLRTEAQGRRSCA